MRLTFHPRVAADISRIMDHYEDVGGKRLAEEFYAELRSFFPPSPAWPVLHVRRPINPGQAVGRGVRFDIPGRRPKVGSGAAVRG